MRTELLEIAYEEHGPPRGPAVVLMHGFPYDVRSYDVVAASLARSGCRVLVPYLRGFGPTRFLEATTLRSGQQAAIGADLRAFMDGLDIERAVLAGYDWGGRAACIVAALWPERVNGLVSVGGYNIQSIAQSGIPAAPEVEHRFWYQYYFHGERGREGLARNRSDLCRLLWRMWSPTWDFDDATFRASAASFDNQDFVDIVIHSYRHRFALADGDSAYEPIEALLAARPSLSPPSVVLFGADDGVDPPGDDPRVEHAPDLFTELVDVHVVAGCGHNSPQEAPDQFQQAVRSVL